MDALKTLENLSLRVITSNFERFYLASGDPILKRGLVFLKRVYSDEIAKSILIGEKIPKHYTDFLINEYLTCLNTDWLHELSWETITEKLAEMGSNLKTVYFGECLEKVPPLNIIHYLPNLETAIFWSCNDEILKSIENFCPNILKLDVRFCRDITDRGIMHLCKTENGVISCPKLKELYFYACRVKDAGIEHLIKNRRSLETTDCDIPAVLYSLHKNDLSVLEKIEPYNFTCLNLLGLEHVSHYTDLLKICTSLCPRLKYLACPILEKHHLDFLFSLNILEELNLKCSKNSEVDISNLLILKGSKLTFLDIKYGSLSVSTLAKSCPRLMYLRLENINFLNNCEIHPVFQHLKVCAFKYFPCDSAAALSISILFRSSPELLRVFFEFGSIRSKLKVGILQYFKRRPKVICIFRNCSIEMKFLKDMVVNCPPFGFDVFDCDVIDGDMDELLRLAAEERRNIRVIL